MHFTAEEEAKGLEAGAVSAIVEFLKLDEQFSNCQQAYGICSQSHLSYTCNQRLEDNIIPSRLWPAFHRDKTTIMHMVISLCLYVGQ
jgi:hypothetical protein